MPNMPELPLSVDPEQRQEDGVTDTKPVYQTHRGKRATSRDVGMPPPHGTTRDGALRYTEAP